MNPQLATAITKDQQPCSLTPDDWIRWTTPAVSDGLRQLGRAFQTVDGGIKPLDETMAAAGPAYTVRCYPGATWAMEQVIEQANPGDVLVVDGGGYRDAILMGGLMSTRLHQRGIAGVVVDGAVRDIDAIKSLGLPVFTRHICPKGGTFAEIGEWQTTVCCGRVPVTPGDWIVADRCGVVVVPQDMIQAAASAAEAIHQKEAFIEAALNRGLTIAEAAQQYEKNHGPGGRIA